MRVPRLSALWFMMELQWSTRTCGMMEQQLLKLKCCQAPMCLTSWGCGAPRWLHQLGHTVKDPLTPTLEMLEWCFPPSGTTLSLRWPHGLWSVVKSNVWRRDKAEPQRGVLGCVRSVPKALDQHSRCGLLCTSCFATWVSHSPCCPKRDGGLWSSGAGEGVPAPAG